MSDGDVLERDLRAALEQANLPSLLPVLTQLTGDTRWLQDPYRPRRGRGLDENDSGDLPEEIQREVRDAAYDAILAWQRGAPPRIPDPSRQLLVRMMAWSMGEPVGPEYAPMLADELETATGAAAALRHPNPPLEVPEDFIVLVVGAGISGLCAGVRLGAMGIPYAIVERNPTVGGVWLENRYPGCAVDTPNHLYSFSFAPHDWSRYFAPRDEIHAYLERVADTFDVRRHIRFQTEMTAATYDADRQGWSVQTRGPDGQTQTLWANVLISAVGAFNKPRTPSIPGLETFVGPVAHTARWPADLDVTGRRVAVVGNGATGMQLVPAIAGTAASVTVFQRSAQWAAPFVKFKQEIPGPVRTLLREVPLYRLWYRLREAWIFNDRIYDSLQRDPDWEHPDRSVNAANDAHRRFFTGYIESELGERTDLLDQVLPDYPPFGKRMLLDNRWFSTVTRDDVELVTDAIAEVRPDRVVTVTGDEYEADAVVLATGFDVVRFLAGMEIRGRSGRTLSETWDGDNARAYLGTVVPDFPNLFTLYGPNTQTGHGGSVITMMEMQMQYVADMLEQMIRGGLGAVECRQDVHDQYNERVDAAHERMVWTHPGMDTYYRNARGRVVVNNPFRVIELWTSTHHADLDDYVTEPAHRHGLTPTRRS